MSIQDKVPKFGVTTAVLAQVARRSKTATADRLYSSRPYRWILRGPMPDRLLRVPEDLWPGEAAVAEAMMAGRWTLAGRQVELGAAHPFDAPCPDRPFCAALHGFAWLHHFHALGSENGERAVRGLTREWIARYSEPTADGAGSIAWAPAVIGRRLISWACHARLVLDSSDLIFRSQVLRAMVRQSAHLARIGTRDADGPDRMASAVGLSFAGLVLPMAERHLALGLQRTAIEAALQILPDGGHISRSPEALMHVLADLVMLKSALLQARAEIPSAIQTAIDRATPMLRFFRHGDGGLALFNGTAQPSETLVDRILTQADAKGRPLGLAPHSGFGRLQSKRVMVVMDCGAPPPWRESRRAHAGCLSFEMSVGRHRLVTNCGDGRLLGPAWEDAGRSTAAHSTLIVDDTSQLRFLTGRARHWLGPRPLPWSGEVQSSREEDAQGLLLEARHELYRARFGVSHHRRIFLDTEGEDLRGEDTLERTPNPSWTRLFQRRSRPAVPFAIRFHLHPDARASLARDGKSVLLALSNGDGWVFRASGAQLDLEESIYLGDPAALRRTKQIVLNARLEEASVKIKWAFKRG